MANRISLDGGDWQFKGYLGDDWLWRDAHKPGTRDVSGWTAGTVPGSVHNDLWRAGEIPDPYFERNSLLLEWIPERTWVYKKRFLVGEQKAGGRARLVLDGVDYEAEFFLNGERLGRHRGMFTPVEFDVTDRLHYAGENLLAVVLAPAPREVSQVGRTSEVRTHKTRMNYGWDFCPRMVHVGIWDHAYLDLTGPARLDDVWVRPSLSDDFSRADVTVTIQLGSAAPIDAEIQVTIHLCDEVAAAGREMTHLEPGEATVALSLNIDRPRLWYPNGRGEQPLYTAGVSVRTREGESDSRRVSFGIRRINMVPNERAEPGARPYTFVVNGEKVYIKGWNWVPVDALYGVERPGKLEHLLALAQRAHVNLLRVWGGGLIEKEEFYDWCDRLGILVWQEFIQSSSGIESCPPDDPQFVAMMVREAEQIIPRRRNHPSLALWCGGNELQSEQGEPLDERAPVLRALQQTAARLDPGRHWLPTSPSGRVFGNNLETVERDPAGLHDVHGPWEYQGPVNQYSLYNRGGSLFHSEFGAEGITNARTLNALIGREHQMPFSRSNPAWQHLGSWWVNEAMLRELFGDVDDVEALARASQFLQAEGLRYALEANERRMFQNSGSIPWQFDESYPNGTSTSAVDYYGEPKAAYFAVKRAYEPIHVSARYSRLTWAGQDEFQAAVWVANTAGERLAQARVDARLAGLSGREYMMWSGTAVCEANRANAVLSLAAPLAGLEEIFFLDLVLSSGSGPVLSRNRYLFSRGANLVPLWSAPETGIQVNHTAAGDAWDVVVKNDGECTALFIRLEDARAAGAPGYVSFSDNDFCLFPGENRDIGVEWRGVPAAKRRLVICGWNTPAVEMR